MKVLIMNFLYNENFYIMDFWEKKGRKLVERSFFSIYETCMMF